MRSIAIVGKGPSVLRCTREFVESHDDIAICNFQPMIGFEHLIGDRADIEYSNDTARLDHPPGEVAAMGIRERYSTDSSSELVRSFDFRGLDPSTGIVALSHSLDKGLYDSISLIGFDMCVTGQRAYYFDFDRVPEACHYLYEQGVYDRDMMVFNAVSGHNTGLSIAYLEHVFQSNPQVKFVVYTTHPFRESSNVKLA